MPTPPAVLEHYEAMQRLQVATLGATRSIWSQMNAAPEESWPAVSADLVTLITAAQLAASEQGAGYVAAALDDVGVEVDPEAAPAPRSLAGVASDGRALPALLDGALYVTSAALVRRQPASAALAIGGRWLDMVTRTQVTDAAREAAGLAIAVRPRVGWVRMVNPPCCGRCAIQAGKWFRYNAGFERHPRCFPAGVITSGPQVNRATRRWYDGELVILATESGQELPVTGNHPVLTSRGWLPANLIREGDDVVRSTSLEGAHSLVVPHHDQVPARIEDVWRSLSMDGLCRMEGSSEDFHGDGRGGQVDVVGADGALGRHVEPGIGEPPSEQLLARAAGPTGALATECIPGLLAPAQAPSPDGVMGGRGLRLALGRGGQRVAGPAGLAHGSPLHPSVVQYAGNGPAGDLVLAGEPKLAGTSEVSLDNGRLVKRNALTRWDAAALSRSVEDRAANARVGIDLLKRLAGQVELDRVIFTRSSRFRGHVYSLNSAEGWHAANGLIVSNCDCSHIPATEDAAANLGTNPTLLFERQQITDLSAANRQAIDDGADPGQVVNAYRRSQRGGGGMRTAQVFGRDLKITDEGTTRRGQAYRALRERRQNSALDVRRPGERYRRTQVPRLMPSSIYEIATDRADAIRLLRLNGFITD